MAWEKSGLFRDMDETSKNEVRQIIRKKIYAKDEGIFFNEDKGSAIYIINSGKVKLSRETQDGVESVILVATTGDLLGENLLFGESNYNYSATAVAESEIYILSLPELKMVMKSSAAITNNATQMLLKRNNQLQKELEHIKVQSAPQRIGCFLLGNCKTQTGNANFELPFEKNMIAAKLGMKPETFSRALGELKNQGVKVEGKDVKIESIEKLSAFTCSACSDNFPCDDVG